MNDATKATIWYTVCSILQKGISFIVVPIYTRILTKDEYGEFSVFQSWRDLLIIFATLNLYAGVFTKAMVDHPEERDKYTSAIQSLSTLLTMLLFLIYIIRVQLWNQVLSMDTITVILMFLYFLCHTALTYWSVRQRVEYKYRKLVIVTLLISIVTPLLSIVLLVFTDLRTNAVIWGSLIIQIVVGGYFYIINFVRGKCLYEKNYWKSALRFNIPLVPHYLSLMVLGQSDRIMIKNMCGDGDAGMYSLAYQIAILMNVFITAINGSLVPWIYQKLKENNSSQIKQVCNKLCLLIGVMSAGLMLVAPEGIRILGTDEYYEAIWIIPAVAFGVYLTFCYSLFSNVEFYFSATKFVMVASTVGAIANLVLNYIFIPIFGFVAAGYTTLVCYLIFMLMHYFFMKQVCRKSNNNDYVYDLRFIWLSVLLFFGATCVSLLVYNHSIIRYAIIVLITVGLLLCRNKIISIIKSIKNR